MKAVHVLSLLASPALGHYFFPDTILDGVTSSDWEFIRETDNNPGAHPIEDVTSSLMGCYEKSGRAAAGVQTVAAGSSFGFVSSNSMGHPGPLLFYMARVPDSQDVDSWTPSGNVWFKIDQSGNKVGSYPPFETEMKEFYTTIPSNLAPGNYLLRAEHIGLHIQGAPQFYIACAQLKVTGTGTGTASNLVAFPGAYSASDAGLAFNIYAENEAYPYPGPDVWS